MNEEIIIDGVNVAECEYRHINEFLLKSTCNLSYHKRQDGRMAYKDCQDMPNCLYKQLKRLQKENSQLVTKCSQLKKENEELENKYSKIKDKEWDAYYYASSIKTIFEGARGATEELLKLKLPKKIKYWVNIANMYLHFREETINKEIEEVNNKYKQTLEEIREITNQDRNCMNSEIACCQCCDKLDLIKDKINKVLESEEKNV